jgi:hypothetical protein
MEQRVRAVLNGFMALTDEEKGEFLRDIRRMRLGAGSMKRCRKT